MIPQWCFSAKNGFNLATTLRCLLICTRFMAAIGRFQKGEEIFYAKVVDGELFRLRGDVFGSPSFDRKSTPRKGIKTLIPVVPSKIIAVGLNYADHARELGKPPSAYRRTLKRLQLDDD